MLIFFILGFSSNSFTGESDLILSCRQLMHTCKNYEECLSALYTTLKERDIRSRTDKPTELKRQIDLIYEQVNSDNNLLTEISREISSIESTQKRGRVLNSLISYTTGRIPRMKELEAELMKRFQIISTLMIKDILQVQLLRFELLIGPIAITVLVIVRAP